MVRSHNPENQFFHHPMENKDDDEFEHMSGHALMATAPPASHIFDKPKEMYPFQMPQDVSTGTLAKLLDLSNRLPIDRNGEITPIMAWTVILRDPRIQELDAVDLKKLKDNLLPKVTCYGCVSMYRLISSSSTADKNPSFGAVIEEFEVRDGLLAIYAEKDGLPMTGPIFAPQQVPVYG